MGNVVGMREVRSRQVALSILFSRRNCDAFLDQKMRPYPGDSIHRDAPQSLGACVRGIRETLGRWDAATHKPALNDSLRCKPPRSNVGAPVCCNGAVTGTLQISDGAWDEGQGAQDQAGGLGRYRDSDVVWDTATCEVSEGRGPETL